MTEPLFITLGLAGLTLGLHLLSKYFKKRSKQTPLEPEQCIDPSNDVARAKSSALIHDLTIWVEALNTSLQIEGDRHFWREGGEIVAYEIDPHVVTVTNLHAEWVGTRFSWTYHSGSKKVTLWSSSHGDALLEKLKKRLLDSVERVSSDKVSAWNGYVYLFKELQAKMSLYGANVQLANHGHAVDITSGTVTGNGVTKHVMYYLADQDDVRTLYDNTKGLFEQWLQLGDCSQLMRELVTGTPVELKPALNQYLHFNLGNVLNTPLPKDRGTVVKILTHSERLKYATKEWSVLPDMIICNAKGEHKAVIAKNYYVVEL